MRILLDECVPQKLRDFLPGHTVEYVPEVGWAGVKNGELLSRASQNYDAMITVDKKMIVERDSSTVSLPVIVLAGRSTQLKHIKQLIPQVELLLNEGIASGFHVVRD